MLRSVFLPILSLLCAIGAQPAAAANPQVEDRTFWAPATPPRALYDVDCEIDPAAGLLKGSETIRFTNPSKRPIHRLAMSWALAPDKAIEVTADGKPVSITAGTPMLLDLPRALGPGETVRLGVRFQFQSPSPFKGPYRVVSGWHPRLTWGYRTRDDFVVRLRAPRDYRVATSGWFDAASGVWRGDGLRDFRFVLWNGMQALEADAAGVKVVVLHTLKGADCAKVLLDTAVDAIKFFQERFGFYPHRSLVVLPGGDRPVGGYPNGAAIVVVHGEERFAEKPLEHWRWIMAHEIGHMYWSEHVFAEGPDSLDWVMIGLGIYCDREYSRARGMTARHQAFLDEYAGAVRDGFDTTLDRTLEHFEALGWDYNNKVIHAKGFSLVSALESAIGREAFDRAHRRALGEFAGRRFGWRTLQRLCEEESEQDLEWFFQQWVRSSRYASYEIADQKTEASSGGYVTSVRVRRAGNLETPVPVEAEFADGSRTVKRTDRMAREQTIEFTSSSPLKQVRLDPEHAVALVIPPPSPAGSELARRIRELEFGGAGAPVKELYEAARKTGATRPEDWFRLGLHLYDRGYYTESLDAFRTLARVGGSVQSAAAIAGVWQGHLLDLAGRREEALAAYREALAKWPQDFTLQHDQWQMKIDRKWVEDRLATPFARK